MVNIQIRKLTTFEEMEQVQKLEETVWHIPPIPTHQTSTAIKHGGLVIGAFDGEKLVGFSYGFAGFTDHQLHLCSHQLGILPAYRGQGIGAQLKLVQKEEARKLGYDLMTWTYDPLQSRNAYLNLTKLHGICGTYIQDCYGEMKDGLNQGLPSDRFQIEWWLNSDYVNHFQEQKVNAATKLADCRLSAQQIPEFYVKIPFDPQSAYTDEAYLVPVPTDIQGIKNQDEEVAINWRYKTREIFTTLFNQGYVVIQLQKQADCPVHYYLLVKRNTLPIN